MHNITSHVISGLSSIVNWGFKKIDPLLDLSVQKVIEISKNSVNVIEGEDSIQQPTYWKNVLKSMLQTDFFKNKKKNLKKETLEKRFERYSLFVEKCASGKIPLNPLSALNIICKKTEHQDPLFYLYTLVFLALPYSENQEDKTRFSLFNKIASLLKKIDGSHLPALLVGFRLQLQNETELNWWNENIQNPLIKEGKARLCVHIEQTAKKKWKEHFNFSFQSPSNGTKNYSSSNGYLILLTALAFASVIPQIQAMNDPIRAEFQKALTLPRNATLLKDNRFSLELFLKNIHFCDPNATSCDLPRMLNPFDCNNWDLKDLDFSNINAPKLTITGAPCKCNLNNGKFENSDFEGMIAVNADFSNSIANFTSFKNSQITNCLFDYLKGEASFEKTNASSTSWQEITGKFNFAESILTSPNFQQHAPSNWASEVKSTEYNFTGALIQNGQFQTYYLSYSCNTSFTFIADPHPKGTVFNASIFDLNLYDNVNINCFGGIQFFFNLTDTIFASSFNRPWRPYDGTLVLLGGNLKNVTFPEEFSFPIGDQFGTGCTNFTLCDVSACGRQRLRNRDYSCLTKDCPSVKISNSNTTLTEQFEDALALPRSPDLLIENRLSVMLFLKSLYLCPMNATRCDLPQEISDFNCKFWNLLSVDFSNLNAFNTTFLPKQSSNCDVRNGKFENSHFKNMQAKNADFSNSLFNETSLDEANISGSNFNNLNGNASFQGIFQKTSWNNLSGKFNFALSHLVDVTFNQNIPQSENFFRSTAYNFTGSHINEAQFQTIYPFLVLSAVEASFTLIADAHTSGTLFNGTVFNLPNYAKSLSVYWCRANIRWQFNLTDTTFTSSKIIPPSDDDHYCSAFFYGGNLKNVTFPSDFSFPFQNGFNIGCSNFILENVNVGAEKRLGLANISSLIPNCNSITVINNATLLPSRFQKAYQEQNPLYLNKDRFDVHKYLWSEGFCNKDLECSVTEDILNGRDFYNRLLWDKMHIALTFKESRELSFFNNTIEESEMGFIDAMNSSSQITFKSSYLSKSHFKATAGLFKIKNCNLKEMQLSGSPKKTILKRNTVDQSSVNASSEFLLIKMNNITDSYFAAGKMVKVRGGYLIDSIMEGNASTTRFKKVILDRFTFNTTSDLDYFSDSSLMDLQGNKSLNNAIFKNIAHLKFKLNRDNSTLKWNIKNIGFIEFQLTEVWFIDSLFKNISKLTGKWEGGGWNNSNSHAINVSFNDMEFVLVETCHSLKASKVRQCFIRSGFTFGDNVQFSNYTPPTPPLSQDTRSAIIAISITALFLLSVTIAIIKDKCKNQPGEDFGNMGDIEDNDTIQMERIDNVNDK